MDTTDIYEIVAERRGRHHHHLQREPTEWLALMADPCSPSRPSTGFGPPTPTKVRAKALLPRDQRPYPVDSPPLMRVDKLIRNRV